MTAIKPVYYHNGNIDVIKFSEENFTKDELKGFYRMNVLKYVTRFDKKNGLEDLNKAQFYLDKLKELDNNHDEVKTKSIDTTYQDFILSLNKIKQETSAMNKPDWVKHFVPGVKQ